MSCQPKWIRPLFIVLVGSVLLFTGIKAAIDSREIFSPQSVPVVPAQNVYLHDTPKVVSNFTLPDANGTPLSLRNLQGKFVLLFFGYTHCTSFCPATLADWMRVKAALGTDAAQVMFLFISVDGERDTPSVLKDYLSHFDSSFLAMSGDDATLQRISLDYGLYYTLHKEEGANYSVDHSVESYLINPQGKLTTMFSFGADPQSIAGAIEEQIG